MLSLAYVALQLVRFFINRMQGLYYHRRVTYDTTLSISHSLALICANSALIRKLMSKSTAHNRLSKLCIAS